VLAVTSELGTLRLASGRAIATLSPSWRSGSAALRLTLGDWQGR